MTRCRLFRRLIICVFGLLVGCQSLSTSDEERVVNPNSLAAIGPAVITPSRDAQASVPLDDVIDSYTTLLPMLEDPESQLNVLDRLADLKLERGEALMTDKAVDELDVAVNAYTGLLNKYPDRAENDQILYQLARTYDLKGETQLHLATLTRIIENYPDTTFIKEIQFRRGEILFTDSFYAEAEEAFQAVIDQGDSVFLVNAYYMKGWSQFKQSNYQGSLESYVQVLDRTVEMKGRTLIAEDRYATLVSDLFRVMSLAFSYMGGAESVEDLFASQGPRPYEIGVYDRFAEWLLNKERYSDLVALKQSYIAIHPLSLWAPNYQIDIIDILRVAGFISEINDEKIRFIAEYGIQSDYWREHENGDLLFVKEQLEVLIPEQANRHYVQAQAAKNKKQSGKMTEHFNKAVSFYSNFVETFPVHSDTPQYLFLVGESHKTLKKWPQAIEAYTRAGYDYPEYDNRIEAAYATVVSYVAYAKTWGGANTKEERDRMELLESDQQLNRLRFVDRYPEDSRAVELAYIAAKYSFDRLEYEETISLSERVIQWQPTPKASLILEAQVLLSHSFYEQALYLESEGAYTELLSLMSPKDKRRASINENLAASIFKQAEALLAKGEMAPAVDQLLRIASVTPDAKLRRNAEFDAANYLVELKDWPRAIQVMTAFRQRYPNDKELLSFTPKLALAYRETEQWELAASELIQMYERSQDPREKQDNLYLIAELYERAENDAQTIIYFRKYANTYAEPADIYMEVANKLAELYVKTDKPLKRRFWLAKQMKTVDGLGDKADDRMRYLAAGAAAVLADDAFRQYKSIKLKLPLEKTMVEKTAALEKAMKAYQKTASYGVSQYSTEAGYRMADIYAQLSRDLMDSDRPGGLNALEMEQYEILLEEQAFPFEENAIDIHEQNASRSWAGIYDEWVKDSFESLKTLLPGRYDKPELLGEVINVFD